jgi:NAD(P)H dehydrogenase (quinone)
VNPRISIVYFSSSGVIGRVAAELARGAEIAGAEVRLRAVAEPAPAAGGRTGGPGDAAAAGAPAAPTLDDLDWADGLLFGTPTRFGNIAAPLKAFLDSTSPLALHGKLADKPFTGFVSASLAGGGQEAALLALYHTAFHWGSLIVPTGYTHPVLRRIGGNPYGLAITAATGADLTGDHLASARYVGGRTARLARRHAAAREQPHETATPAPAPLSTVR